MFGLRGGMIEGFESSGKLGWLHEWTQGRLVAGFESSGKLVLPHRWTQGELVPEFESPRKLVPLLRSAVATQPLRGDSRLCLQWRALRAIATSKKETEYPASMIPFPRSPCIRLRRLHGARCAPLQQIKKGAPLRTSSQEHLFDLLWLPYRVSMLCPR